MFTWICPKCGAEVPPAYSDCPNCAKPPEERAAPEAPPSAAPPVQPRRHVQSKPSVPGWLIALLVALVLVGAGAGAYFYLLPSSQSKSAPTAAASPFESPASAPSPAAKAHPFAKFIEIAGFRITEDARQKAQIRYLVVNHSGAELPDLTLTITLKTSTAKPEDKPLAVFPAKAVRLGPYESRDLEASVKTELRAYELPDWQFLRAEFEITSPPAP
jgi:hypothetical protein